jgi:NTE family protein
MLNFEQMKNGFLLLLMMGMVLRTNAQKVGVVLSGGGAQGLAHIGVLKALEENGIPIDYIVGTSIGSVIGALYASGMSTDEMISYVSTEKYWRVSEGKAGTDLQFYYREPLPDAGMLRLKVKKGSALKDVIPTHYIDPEPLDWETMLGFSAASLRCRENFDSLMIPFRCVAADLETKSEVIFSKGSLSEAVRASMTYPFYIPPIRINDHLFYDGGIYNNFPVDVMYNEFFPDVIIGSNVSGKSARVDENDFMSQLENLIVFRDNPPIQCDRWVEIDMSIQAGTFDFHEAPKIVKLGYEQALTYIEQIKENLWVLQNKKHFEKLREQFLAKPMPNRLTNVNVMGLETNENVRLEHSLISGLKSMDLKHFEPRFYSLWKEPYIRSVFPVVHADPNNGEGYALDLRVKKEEPIRIGLGGNFSSRSINTGMVSAQYRPFKSLNMTTYGNSYFGRFYGSVLLGIEFRNRSYRLPMSWSLEYCQNRWDYYRSVSAFFEDTKPSFIINYDQYMKAALQMASSQHSIIKIQSFAIQQNDKYYQSKQFLSVDTADYTQIRGWVNRLTWEYNTLNKTLYASEGSKYMLSWKNVNGTELTIPGTTNVIRDSTNAHQNWMVYRMHAESYFKIAKQWTAGYSIDAGHSTQRVLNNYMSTLIQEQAYRPNPESSTFFLPQFRALTFIGYGLRNDFAINNNLHVRLEGYQMRSYRYYEQDNFSKAVLNRDVVTNMIYSGSVVYHTLAGPLSFQLNYYERKTDPFSLMVHFGYILYNDSPRD